MLRFHILSLCLVIGLSSCQKSDETAPATESSNPPSATSSNGSANSLAEARAGFKTVISRQDPSGGAPDVPPPDVFNLVNYTSPVGELAAYVSPDPGDGQKHAAIIWITGGDCNTIGDIWSPTTPDNDQSARAFREQGLIMMFPSLRGGNLNPGQREGILGEVEDVLAAADYLSKLDYVDADKIYLGGHSTGGTLVMLVAETSDRFQATFSFGPVAAAPQYGGDYVFADLNNREEMALRSPVAWLDSVKTPLYVFEGAQQGNWDAVQIMQDHNENTNIYFFKVPNHDHFSVLHPVTNLIARQLKAGSLQIDEAQLNGI